MYVILSVYTSDIQLLKTVYGGKYIGCRINSISCKGSKGREVFEGVYGRVS